MCAWGAGCTHSVHQRRLLPAGHQHPEGVPRMTPCPSETTASYGSGNLQLFLCRTGWCIPDHVILPRPPQFACPHTLSHAAPTVRGYCLALLTLLQDCTRVSHARLSWQELFFPARHCYGARWPVVEKADGTEPGMCAPRVWHSQQTQAAGYTSPRLAAPAEAQQLLHWFGRATDLRYPLEPTAEPLDIGQPLRLCPQPWPHAAGHGAGSGPWRMRR